MGKLENTIKHIQKSRRDENEKPIGAICAAPLLLLDSKVLRTRKHTAHGSVSDELPNLDTTQRVVQDENLTTSRGAGTAIEFGLGLIEVLHGKEKAKEIGHSIHAGTLPIREKRQ